MKVDLAGVVHQFQLGSVFLIEFLSQGLSSQGPASAGVGPKKDWSSTDPVREEKRYLTVDMETGSNPLIYVLLYMPSIIVPIFCPLEKRYFSVRGRCSCQLSTEARRTHASYECTCLHKLASPLDSLLKEASQNSAVLLIEFTNRTPDEKQQVVFSKQTVSVINR